MADNSIDLVVSKVAFEQLDRLLNEIKLADAAITALNVNAGKAQTTPSGAEGNAAANAALIAQMKSLTAEIDKQVAQIQKLTEAKKTYSRAVTQESVDTTLRNQKAREAFKATSDEIDNYQRLDAAYKKAVKSAQDLGAQYGANSKQFLTAANAAKELDTKLKAIDGAVGKYGRNVGNYASGWNGLANSVNQLTREAPAFANSLNTGFMALSNNIPILADEINNLKKQNLELAASGKPTQSVFKSLTSALFSWQTLLSVGVTLLTLYGAKLIDYAFGLSTAEKAQLKFNEVISDSNNTLKEESVNIESLTAIVNDNNESNKNRQLAYEEIKKTLPGLTQSTYEQAIAEGDLNMATDLYIESLIRKAVVEAEAKEIADEQTKLNKESSKSIKERISWFGRLGLSMSSNEKATLSAIKKIKNAEDKSAQDAINLRKERLKRDQDEFLINQDLLKKYLEDPSKKNKASQKAQEDWLKYLYDANRSEILLQLYKIDLLLNDQNNFFENRFKALEDDKQKRLELAKLDYDEQIRLSKGNQNRQRDALNKYNLDILTIQAENLKNKKVILKQESEEFNDAINEMDAFLKKYHEDKTRDEALTGTADTLQQKAIQNKREKDYEDHLKRLAELAAISTSYIRDFLSNSGFSETFTFFEGEDSLFSRIKKGSAFTKESWKADTAQMMEASQEMYNFISNISQQNFDAEYERLSKQKDITMQFAGDSDSAKRKVEEDYEKRRKQIAEREFKAKKQQAMVNIAIDTAQAIIGLWAKPGFPTAIPMSIAVAALGAIQMGVVAAQKVPQYFEGTDNHPGGLALINDGKGANFKETVVTPDGKVRQFSGRDVVIDAPAGTQVFTHDQWNNELNTMMREKGISMSNSFNSKSGLSYAEMDSIIAKHFSKITTQSTTIDKNGFNTFVSNGNNRTIRNQSRYSGTGFSV
ncbi:hypothetical protein [Flavobacterium sp.]|uniref:hypothetical protein n=1 Tax=Flavobacterium sp. TaxID=239 RepID=UPI0025DE481D|nr:hypothetical protein [Flavobacterium sp.]